MTDDLAKLEAVLRWFDRLFSHKLAVGNRPAQIVDGTFAPSSAAGAFRPSHRTPAEARLLAYGEAECMWHEKYGHRPDPHSCPGCGGPISTTNIFSLPDGARVHDDADLHCLQAYGDRWRGAAAAALLGFGIGLDYIEQPIEETAP